MIFVSKRHSSYGLQPFTNIQSLCQTYTANSSSEMAAVVKNKLPVSLTEDHAMQIGFGQIL